MKEISEIISRELKDPRIISMVSVLDASISNDMRHVKVTVSIFGNNEIENLKTFEALNSASGYISSIVSKELRLKWAPRIHFESSNSIEEGVSMYFKLKEITNNEKLAEKDELPES